MGVFDGLSRKVAEIEIDGIKIKVKPSVKDAEAFITLKQGDLSESDAQKITNILINMIERANPEEKREDIESFVAMNYGKLMQEIAVLYGFATKRDIEAMKKKVTQK